MMNIEVFIEDTVYDRLDWISQIQLLLAVGKRHQRQG